ncbi:hypothetical protein A9Z06_32870 [Rhizobium sp. YK2]|nr:hypothetical protein A9Z06_32870 [Rhizobium sp. YK2]
MFASRVRPDLPGLVRKPQSTPAYRSGIAESMIAHGLASASQAKDRVGDLLEPIGLSTSVADRLPRGARCDASPTTG